MQVVYVVLVSTMTHGVEHVWLPVRHLHSVSLSSSLWNFVKSQPCSEKLSEKCCEMTLHLILELNRNSYVCDTFP